MKKRVLVGLVAAFVLGIVLGQIVYLPHIIGPDLTGRWTSTGWRGASLTLAPVRGGWDWEGTFRYAGSRSPDADIVARRAGWNRFTIEFRYFDSNTHDAWTVFRDDDALIHADCQVPEGEQERHCRYLRR